MATPTRVDEDLQEYYRLLQEKEHIEDGDIRRLLDVYRTKFDVDLVYIGEVTADRKGIWFPYVSAPKERMGLQGERRAVTADDLERLGV